MKLRIILAFFLALATCSLHAQLRYGFKTGLNFARIDGPAETDASGNVLETYKNTTGFHIGMTLGHRFTDNFGVRGEFLYSKKGMKYTFDGPSYRICRYDGGTTTTTGNVKYLININNSYIDIPVLAYLRWRDFEISGGGYVGFLIQSTGDGSMTYSNGKTAPLMNAVYQDVNSNGQFDTGEDKIQFNLSYNYRKDDPGEGKTGEQVVVRVDARNIELPKTIGAYFDDTDNKGSLFNTADYGLVGGISYYLSSSLYATVRLQYGLGDVTNNKVDAYRTIPAGVAPQDFKTPLPSADKDRNFVIQASVGFSF